MMWTEIDLLPVVNSIEIFSIEIFRHLLKDYSFGICTLCGTMGPFNFFLVGVFGIES